MDTNITTNPSSLGSTNGSANGQSSVVDIDLRSLYYGKFKAVRDTQLTIKKNTITAFIGPSGCGKSTVLRSINRMNDLIRGFRFEGQIRFRGKDIYDATVDPVAVRRHIGMVFQQPNPFAMSIYRNVAYRSAAQRLSRQPGRKGRSRPCAAPPCGTKSRTSCTPAAWPFPAASSSGCASPGRSPRSPRCC